jgi:hypothetical protein
MSKNIVFAWAGNVIILYQVGTPTAEEWKRYTDSLRAKKEILKDMSKGKAIAFSEGGSLTAAQRKEVNEIIGPKGGLAVVFSTSAIMRGVVTGLSWFNPLIKAFAPEDKDAAFKHLQLTAYESAEVERTIDRLRLEIKGGSAKAS